MPMKRKNSARVLGSARNVPTILLAIINTPRLCTPRVVMLVHGVDHDAYAARFQNLIYA